MSLQIPLISKPFNGSPPLFSDWPWMPNAHKQPKLQVTSSLQMGQPKILVPTKSRALLLKTPAMTGLAHQGVMSALMRRTMQDRFT
jgi:hypothetical protein